MTCACNPSITDPDGHVVTCNACRRKWSKSAFRPVPMNAGAEASEEYMNYTKHFVTLGADAKDVNGVRPIPDVFQMRPDVLNGKTYYCKSHGIFVTFTERDGKPAECLLSGNVNDEQKALAGIITLAFKNNVTLEALDAYLPKPGHNTFMEFFSGALSVFMLGLEGRELLAKGEAVYEEGQR